MKPYAIPNPNDPQSFAFYLRPMNQLVKARFVSALRAETRPQSYDLLEAGGKISALGILANVLIELRRLPTNVTWKRDGQGLELTVHLPVSEAPEAKPTYRHTLPLEAVYIAAETNREAVRVLASLNDLNKMTLAAIADWVEAFL